MLYIIYRFSYTKTIIQQCIREILWFVNKNSRKYSRLSLVDLWQDSCRIYIL